MKFSTISWESKGWLNCWMLKSPIHLPFEVSRRLVIEPPQWVLQQVLLLFSGKDAGLLLLGEAKGILFSLIFSECFCVFCYQDSTLATFEGEAKRERGIQKEQTSWDYSFQQIAFLGWEQKKDAIVAIWSPSNHCFQSPLEFNLTWCRISWLAWSKGPQPPRLKNTRGKKTGISLSHTSIYLTSFHQILHQYSRVKSWNYGPVKLNV